MEMNRHGRIARDFSMTGDESYIYIFFKYICILYWYKIYVKLQILVAMIFVMILQICNILQHLQFHINFIEGLRPTSTSGDNASFLKFYFRGKLRFNNSSTPWICERNTFLLERPVHARGCIQHRRGARRSCNKILQEQTRVGPSGISRERGRWSTLLPSRTTLSCIIIEYSTSVSPFAPSYAGNVFLPPRPRAMFSRI